MASRSGVREMPNRLVSSPSLTCAGLQLARVDQVAHPVDHLVVKVAAADAEAGVDLVHPWRDDPPPRRPERVPAKWMPVRRRNARLNRALGPTLLSRLGATPRGIGSDCLLLPLPHPSWSNNGWLKRHP